MAMKRSPGYTVPLVWTLISLFGCSLLIDAASEAKSSGRPLLFKYVITNVAVEPVSPGSRIKPRSRVEFHALTKGQKDLKAYTLTDVVDTGRKKNGRHPIYEATVIDPSDFQSKIDGDSPNALDWIIPFRHRKSLLCVHGFNTQPENWFKECANYRKYGNYTVVPVIWPAGDKGVQSYLNDRERVAPEAAKAFRPLLQVAQSLRGNSILCHSMGNYVLRLVAAAPSESGRSNKPAFDQVFMVAADVRDDIFNSVRNKSPDPSLNHGKNIGALARQQVHVLYSSWDLALSVGRRVKLKWEGALGSKGVHPQKLHKDLRKKVVSLNCNSFNKWSWNNNLWHGYQFKSEAIKYYEKQRDTTTQ